MKVFIGFLVAFAAIISVNCDAAADQKAWVAKVTAEYTNMSETEIKTHVNSVVKDIEGMMKTAADKYMKEDLEYVAGVYESIIQFIDAGLLEMYTTLDKLDAKLRKTDLVGLGVTVEGIKLAAQMETVKRAAGPLNVTDNEENLWKQFNDIKDKVLVLDKQTADTERKKPELVFWADVHQGIYDFMVEGLKNIETELKQLKSTEIRAKNLQVMINDLTLLLATADTREKTTFMAKVSAKFSQFVTKVKSFFG